MRARLLWLLIRSTAPSVALGIVVGASFIVVETLVVCLLNEASGATGFGVLYLLGVLVVSTVWRLLVVRGKGRFRGLLELELA